MHNQLSDYHIVAPAICETSNPHCIVEAEPSNTNDMHRSIESTSKGPGRLNEMLDPGAGLLTIDCWRRERSVQRLCTGIVVHAGKNPRCGRINAFACRTHTSLQIRSQLIRGSDTVG